MRLRCLILALPVFISLVTADLMPGWYASLTLTLIVPPCLFGLLITLWRMSILQNRVFTPLFRWLTARFIKTRSA